MKNKRTFSFYASTVLALSLAACSGGSDTQNPQNTVENKEVSVGPEAKPGISASDGRLVLPVVGGRPAAAYFNVRNNSAAPVTLASVHIAGASKSEMHETKGGTMQAVASMPITPGASVVFAPGGLHVMAFDLDESLKTATTAELTLTFSDGDKVSIPLQIEKMGEGSHH